MIKITKYVLKMIICAPACLCLCCYLCCCIQVTVFWLLCLGHCVWVAVFRLLCKGPGDSNYLPHCINAVTSEGVSPRFPSKPSCQTMGTKKSTHVCYIISQIYSLKDHIQKVAYFMPSKNLWPKLKSVKKQKSQNALFAIPKYNWKDFALHWRKFFTFSTPISPT